MNERGCTCTIFKMFSFFLKRSIKELKHRLCYYIISLCSCFLAIYVALIANSIISQAPIIFLKIAEITQGEVDIVFNPNTYAKMDKINNDRKFTRYFNMSTIDNLTFPDIGLLSPQLIFERVYAEHESKSVGVTLMAIDSQREKNNKIGSKYDPPLLKQGECAIHRSHSRFLEVKIGDKFTLNVVIKNYMTLLHKIHDPKWDENITQTINITCTVGSIFKDLGGKLPIDDDEDYVCMELTDFLKHLSNEINDTEEFKEFVGNLDPYQIVTRMVVNHPNRDEIYIDNDFYRIQHNMAQYANEMVTKLGFYPIDSKMPILTALLPLNMGAIFLSIILNLIVIHWCWHLVLIIWEYLTLPVNAEQKSV